MSQSFFGGNAGQKQPANFGRRTANEGQNLSRSTFMADETALRALTKGIAAGKSVIGGGVNMSPTAESKLNSLALLLDSEDAFEMAFSAKADEQKGTSKHKSKQQHNHVEALLQQSRSFFVKGQQYQYKNDEQIFFITEPTVSRHQLANCLSCGFKFEATKQMCFCQFCGCANCKDCIKKTRFFYDQQQNVGGPSSISSRRDSKLTINPDRKRGKICTLCDRKFIINKQMAASFKIIDVQNIQINHSKKEIDKHQVQLEEETRAHERVLAITRSQIEFLEPDIQHLEHKLKQDQQDLESGNRDQEAVSTRLMKREVEVEQLRRDIETIEAESIITSEERFQLMSKIHEEQTKMFQLEQELEKFTRKGKQPKRQSGQGQRGTIAQSNETITQKPLPIRKSLAEVNTEPNKISVSMKSVHKIVIPPDDAYDEPVKVSNSYRSEHQVLKSEDKQNNDFEESFTQSRKQSTDNIQMIFGTEESFMNPDEDEDTETLSIGKKESRSRRKEPSKIQRQSSQKNAMCNDKSCCLIF